MAYSGIAKLALKLIRETMKKKGVDAGIELGTRLGAPQKMIHTAIMRSTKKNAYGTFAQRKIARTKALEKARMLGGGGPKRGYERRNQARAGEGFVDPANQRPLRRPPGQRERAQQSLEALRRRMGGRTPAGREDFERYGVKRMIDNRREF